MNQPATITSLDPRTLSTPVYEALQALRENYPRETHSPRLKEQKGQAVELYTYLATWGMMRLKAEENALSQEGKQDVVRAFFRCLESISGTAHLAGENGLETIKDLGTEDYLGLTGLGLKVAQEFGFWATAVYHDIKGEA